MIIRQVEDCIIISSPPETAHICIPTHREAHKGHPTKQASNFKILKILSTARYIKQQSILIK